MCVRVPAEARWQNNVNVNVTCPFVSDCIQSFRGKSVLEITHTHIIIDTLSYTLTPHEYEAVCTRFVVGNADSMSTQVYTL